MSYTLKQITNAFAEAHPTTLRESGEELEAKMLIRGRNLRDKGNIKASDTATLTRPTFTEGDAVAVCAALALNVAGVPLGYIHDMTHNFAFRGFESAKDPMAFENAIAEIKDGKPVFVSVAWCADVSVWAVGWMDARFGSEPTINDGTAINIVLPVTPFAKPVLEILAKG